jgi:hypothetical protein
MHEPRSHEGRRILFSRPPAPLFPVTFVTSGLCSIGAPAVNCWLQKRGSVKPFSSGVLASVRARLPLLGHGMRAAKIENRGVRLARAKTDESVVC